MYNKKPPFEITNFMLDEIAEIAELVGHVNATAGLSTNPMLRRTNRIRSVYSSLAIEQNNLSLEQVTAVLNGKKVIAPPKDIAEVKNACSFKGNATSKQHPVKNDGYSDSWLGGINNDPTDKAQ